MCYPYLDNETTYYLGDSELWLDNAFGQENPIGSSVVEFIMKVFSKVMKGGCFGLFAVAIYLYTFSSTIEFLNHVFPAQISLFG
jgi:hypothetical protein